MKTQKKIWLYEFYLKWCQFLSLTKKHPPPLLYHLSFNCLESGFCILLRKSYFKVFNHLLVKSIAFHLSSPNVYAVFYANNHVLVSWVSWTICSPNSSALTCPAVSLTNTHNRRNCWVEKNSPIKGKDDMLVQSSCFLSLYSPSDITWGECVTVQVR